MSHFSVMVSLKTPDQKELEAALQPFHQYECTGILDQYVVFTTEETEEELVAEHKRQLEKYPATTEEDFNAFVKEYYGYEKRNAQWGRFTNPNKKWDWWVIGGRFSNELLTKKGLHCDQCFKKEIDFKTMQSEAAKKADKQYTEVQEIFNGEKFMTWEEILEEKNLNLKEKREKYRTQPPVKRFKKIYDSPFSNPDEFNVSRESFIQKAEFRAISTFAILHNNTWQERGKMGWWGAVSEKAGNWQETFMNVLNSIPDDNYIVIVDCHI